MKNTSKAAGRGLPIGARLSLQEALNLEQAHLFGVYTTIRQPMVIERGEGEYLIDAQGSRYLDLVSGGRAVTTLGHCPEPVVQALLSACRRHGGKVEVFPLHAGAAPLYLFTELLGLPFAFGGLGHGLHSHARNEFISVEGMRDFFRSMASFLFAFAETTGRC